MELNEITKNLPPHLLQFVVDQPYEQYTPVDQAVWRYVMRKNYMHLSKVAHKSYVDGLQKAGIGIDNIPTLYGMNRILKEIGWAAVAVDGFIPPGAFMEFTAHKVLVIAADIRTLEHIEYTPAPDIIHESAGHAPIIAHPDFAEYLIQIGKIGAKAFSSKKDNELYEAIRHLSIIKEDPYSSPEEIMEGEEVIRKTSADMGKPSEMALLRNLHWWTVEYGLIGTLINFRIYGAGLLSSIGESESCLKPNVRKYPYTIDAASVNYDITRSQPQLFVTPDFSHLTTVLNEFAATMAFRVGGKEGMEKAIESEGTSTAVLSNGMEISGTFTKCISDIQGNIAYIQTDGPSALSFKNQQLPGQGKDYHSNGIAVAMGPVKYPDDTSENQHFDLENLFTKGKEVIFETQNFLKINGLLIDIIQSEKKTFALYIQGSIHYMDDTLFKGSFLFSTDNKISSAYAGPSDSYSFMPEIHVSKEKTPKIQYSGRTLKLHKLYQLVRDIREKNQNQYLLPKIASLVQTYFPDDWLLNLEILELVKLRGGSVFFLRRQEEYLHQLKARKPVLEKLIEDGISLIEHS